MIFRTFSTDAAKCKQLPLQSPFSFRRLAPAVDYLGSPFSAFFRPLLLGFPLCTFVLRFLFLPLGLRFLSSAFTLLPVTQHPVLLFSFLPGSPHSGSPVLLRFFRSLGFFPFRPGLVSHPFLPVLLTQLSCIVSFRPSQFRSRSRSTGAHLTFCFWASSQMFAHAFRPLSFSSGLELNYSASVSSFPFFHRFCLTVGFSVSQVCFRFLVFPLTSSLVSRAFFPVLSTQLSVCFLSSFPASLPQLFHRCFPFGFLLWDQRLASVLFRSLPL